MFRLHEDIGIFQFVERRDNDIIASLIPRYSNFSTILKVPIIYRLLYIKYYNICNK